MSDFDPVIDPETGEVLATSPEEQHAAYLVALADVERYDREYAEVRVKLADARRHALSLWWPAAPAYAHDGRSVLIEVTKPNRQVNTAFIDEHSEKLPEAVQPVEVVTTKRQYPGVREITAAKAKLAASGLTPDALLIQPEPRQTIRILEDA